MGRNRLTLGLDAAKINDYIKNGLSKSGWELNFLQKTQWAHMYIFPRNGAKELQGFICFKCYIVPKGKSRLTLGLNTAENTDYVQNFFKEKLFWIKFFTKSSMGACVFLSRVWS